MIVLITGILLLIVSLITRKRYTAYIGFAFVFLIMGFQSNVDGDFMAYMDSFYHIANNGDISYDRTSETEPVMPILMLLFSWAPWWFFVICLSAFQTLVLAKFVEKYCDKPYKFLAAILFFFTFNMMLLQMKAMRQGLAIEMLVLAFILADKRKGWLKSVILAVLAFFTHNASVVLIIFLAFYWIVLRKPAIMEKIGNGKMFPLLVVGLYLVLVGVRMVFLDEYFSQYLLALDAQERFSGYASGQNQTESIQYLLEEATPSLMVILYNGVMVFLISLFYQNVPAKLRFFAVLSIIASITTVYFNNIGTLARIVMFFSVFNIIIYPNIAVFLQRRFGGVFAWGFSIVTLYTAWLTSVAWITGMEKDHYGVYQFFFM